MEEVPMKLNDSISIYDVAEGHSIISLEWAGSEPNLQPILVRKVAQPITTEGRTKRSAAA
jgi:hypothetical protein